MQMHGRFRRTAGVLGLVAGLSLTAVPGALALSNGGGNSGNAAGQTNAAANCHNVYVTQLANNVIAQGGPKAGYGDPQFNTPDNCDHYYGAPGQLP
jgi:hypothetical protein